MTVTPWPRGLITPLLTPFTADDIVDEQALVRLIDRQLSDGAAGVVLAGGTGEYGTLDLGERRRVAEVTAEHLDGRLPFFVHSGALATRDSLALGRHAAEVGATGLLVASPFGEPISWRERLRFYETVDAATELPIMVYNTPPAGLLTRGQIEQLAALPRVGALKYSSSEVTLLGDLLAAQVEMNLAVYVGIDSLIDVAAVGGARGVVVGTGNLLARQIISTFQAACDRRPTPRWERLRSVLRFAEESSNYVALIKLGLRQAGADVGDVRAPYLMPDHQEAEAFAVLLADLEDTHAAEGLRSASI